MKSISESASGGVQSRADGCGVAPDCERIEGAPAEHDCTAGARGRHASRRAARRAGGPCQWPAAAHRPPQPYRPRSRQAGSQAGAGALRPATGRPLPWAPTGEDAIAISKN
jgi:hypothetical protein